MSQMSQIYQKMPDGSFARLDQPLPDDMAPVLVRSKYVPGGSQLNQFMYLSQDGSDANDGRSVEYPLKTLKKAVEVSRGIKGHVILEVLPGTYNIDLYTTPSVADGIDYRCRLFGKFLEFDTIRAYDSTSKPIFTGSALACYGNCNFTNIEFHLPVRAFGPYAVTAASCNFIQSADAQHNRVLTVDGGVFFSMGNCNIEVSKNVGNMLAVSVVTGAYFCGYAANNIERSVPGATNYLLGIGSSAVVYQYAGGLNFSDSSGKPLAVYNSASFYDVGNAAPSGSFIGEHALIW